MNMRVVCFSIVIALLTACGGGGTGNSVSETPTPTPAPSPTPIQQPPAPSNNIPDPLTISYSGATTNANIDEENAGALTVNILESLDLLNALVLGSSYSRYQFFEDPSDLKIDDSQSCSTGSSFLQNNSNNTVTAVTYANCRLGDTVIDGELVSFVDTVNTTLRSTINFDLTFSFNDGSNAAMYGHVYTDIEDKYIYNLIITGDEEIYWFDEFLVDATSARNLSISNQGDLYIGSQGKISISTQDVEFNSSTGRFISSLNISGNETLNVVVDTKVQLTIDAQFLKIPLILDLVNFQGLPENNEAPNLVVVQSTSGEYGEPVDLDLSQSTDPNLDVISYSINVENLPEDAEFTISEKSPSVFSMVTTRPGTYELEVVASDASGLTDTSKLSIYFTRKEPSATINFSQHEFLYSEKVQASYSITNEPFDGPFDVSLAYGPEGMKMVDGEIIWDVNLPNLASRMEVSFGLRVENPDKSVLIERTFNVLPNTAPKITPVTIRNLNEFFVLSGYETPKAIINGMVFDLVLNDDYTVTIKNSNLFSNLPFAQSQVLSVGDFNNDDVTDVIYYQFDEKINKIRILLNTENDFSKDVELLNFTPLSKDSLSPNAIEVANFADTPGLEYYFKVFGTQISNALVTQDSGILDTHVNQLGGSDIPFCDLDDDGVIDWISSGSGQISYRISGTNDLIPLNAPEPYDVYVGPIITGLATECNVVFERTDMFSYSGVYVESDIRTLQNVRTFDYQTAYRQQVNRPDENFIRVPNMGDINQNGQVDFYVSIPSKDEETGYLLIFEDVFTDTLTIRKLTFDGKTPENLNLVKLKDIDKDGILEVVTFIYDASRSRIAVSKLFTDKIETYLGEWQNNAIFDSVESWYADQAISSFPVDVTFQDILALSPSKTARFEQGLTVTYETNIDESVLEKSTASGLDLWTANIPDIFLTYSIISDDLLLTDRSVYDRITGDLIFNIPIEATLIRSITSEPIVLRDDENVYFFVRYWENNNANAVLRSYTIDNDKNVAEIDLSFIDLSKFSPDNIGYTGISNDLALISTSFQTIDNITEKVGFRLDLNNRTLEPLELYFADENEFGIRRGSILNLCLINSESCTTRTYSKSALRNSRSTGLYGVDSVTGHKVWETIDYIPTYSNLSVIKTSFGLVTLIETSGNLYIIE